MDKKSNLILASGSNYRRILLAKLGIPFEYASPDIDETRATHEPLIDYVQRLSIEKALTIGRRYNDHLIIGSDQAATNSAGDLLTKPHTIEAANTQLSSLSGKTAMFYTGLTLYNSKTNNIQTITETTTVAFRELSAEQIQSYITKDNPLDCAGSFKCEYLGISLFKAIEGRDPNALIGLPLIALTEMLAVEGIDPLTW